VVEEAGGSCCPPALTKMILNIIQTLDDIDDILDSETKENKIPFLLKTGLKLVSKGLHSELKKNEEKPKSMSFKTSFIVVVVIHIAVVLGIAYMPKTKAIAAIQKEDRDFLNRDRYTTTDDYPKPKNYKMVETKLTTSYIVKRGDTFDSIVKKFKLNPSKLKKINRMESDNVYVGMNLKLM
jgi:LysM repeat protein